MKNKEKHLSKNEPAESSGNKNVSRRDFLKNASLATAGFYFVPRHVLGGPGYVAPSDTLYIAGVGAGGKGESDLNNFAKSGNAKIAYLCDVDDRRSANSRKRFPDAPYYHDWREMLDKESDNFDAVSVSIPDHNHAIVALNAMQRGKHVYVQKPLTHDIYEARMLTKAAEKYDVVTQMGDQGASSDGIRTMKEWYEAGIIGDIEEVYCWTDRPVWPQGIPWPDSQSSVPKELDWDLWLGTAEKTNYIENLVPFNWRGWWAFGTGALGDMGCHIVGPAFKVLDLGYPHEVISSVSTIYEGIFKEAYYPKSGPVSSSSHLKYDMGNGKEMKLHWMDGGIQPERPPELEIDETMGDGGNGALFIGSKGKFMCSTYGHNPRLIPVSKTEEAKANIPKKYTRVPNGSEGHYKQWVDACLKGADNGKVDSPFVSYAGPLTESILMANLAIRSFNYRVANKNDKGEIKGYRYPGRGMSLEWDAKNMKVTNFDPANQYVKRDYRSGWDELTV